MAIGRRRLSTGRIAAVIAAVFHDPLVRRDFVCHIVLIELFDRADFRAIRRRPDRIQRFFPFNNRAIMRPAFARAFVLCAAFFARARDRDIHTAAGILGLFHVLPGANHTANLVAVAFATAAIAAAVAAFVAGR